MKRLAAAIFAALFLLAATPTGADAGQTSHHAKHGNDWE